MAYRREGNDIIWDGWELGIGAAPYSGLQTLGATTSSLGMIANANIISVPKEASVGFATSSQTLASITGSVVSADATGDTITYSGTQPTNQQAVVFTGASLPAGITAATTYWVINAGATTFQISAAPGSATPVNITGTGTGTYATTDMGRPLHWTVDKNSRYYIMDANGRVWYGTGTIWVFTGNTTLTNANGNGLGYYQASDGTGYIFAFRNNKIDYMPIASLGSWTYAWQTLTKTTSGQANSHYNLVGQDNVLYFANTAFVGSFFEKSGSTFDPSSSGTYTYTETALALPTQETSTWLAELGQNLMVGGTRNLIYPWDRISTSYTFPLFLPEYNVARLITVNTTMYIFMGTRGRIYRTNGSQVVLYIKVPDFISGTIDPYFAWGAVGTNKNQIYFGVSVTTNGAVAVSGYGGLWAIDTDSDALRLVNKLSYGTYLGYATVYLPNPTNGAAGSGFYVGWDSGATTYGVDVSSSTPYTNYETTIDTDMTPVGTLLKPYTGSQFEFKLTKPLVSGEGVKILYRTDLSQSFTLIGETTTVGAISDNFPNTFQNAQWIQLQIALKSTGSTPSYVRLKEVRMITQG